jgi:UDP-glucose 4-epimerase
MGSNILVTGGAGFIGSHLVTRLVNEGQKVTVIDNLSRGKLINLANVLDKIEVVTEDISKRTLMETLIKDSDLVFHLASISRVMPSIRKPAKCFKENVGYTEIISRLCSKHKKKIIFSSSREVYGTAKYLPVDENHPLNPENPYGASKVCAEKIITSYSKCYGLEYAILRLSNVYGANDFDRVIPIFVDKTLRKEPLIIYGGQQVVDFIYVVDVVEAFLKASKCDDKIIVNVGSGKGITVKDLAKLMQKISSGSNKMIFRQKRIGEVERFVAKIERAKESLEWTPKTELKEGLMSLLKTSFQSN